jgi:hypothetical protein
MTKAESLPEPWVKVGDRRFSFVFGEKRYEFWSPLWANEETLEFRGTLPDGEPFYLQLDESEATA